MVSMRTEIILFTCSVFSCASIRCDDRGVDMMIAMLIITGAATAAAVSVFLVLLLVDLFSGNNINKQRCS